MSQEQIESMELTDDQLEDIAGGHGGHHPNPHSGHGHGGGGETITLNFNNTTLTNDKIIIKIP